MPGLMARLRSLWRGVRRRDEVEAEMAEEFRLHLALRTEDLIRSGGRELAESIVAVRSDIKVVYMSGFTDDAIVHHGVLAPGTAFIEKPITADVLLTKLREFLSYPEGLTGSS